MPVDPLSQDAEEERFRVSMQGLALAVPPQWEARIRLVSASEEEGISYPVIHAATVPLPAQRGDYGSNVVERLSADDVFVGLLEFGAEAVDSALFPPVDEIPRSVSPDEFHPRQLQRVLPGQAGKQIFFTYQGRAFCLYVVVGSFARRAALAAKVEELLRELSIETRSTTP